MRTRRIGSLSVTVVGIGCNNFGGRIDKQATQQVVDSAIEQGINFFDTADIYGGWGKSEEFLGKALGKRRAEAVVATKFGFPLNDEHPGGGRPETVRRACEESLQRLATDHIDLYQLHRPDPSVPMAETLGALDDLVKAGKVREIGCSNFDVAGLREAWDAAPGVRYACVQNELSLLKREGQAEVLAECEKLGMAYLPFFPLASGLLTGKYRKGSALPEGTRIKDGSDWLKPGNLERVERLTRFAEAKGRTILELAFAWLLSHQPVSSVIAGATSAEQVRANAAAASWILTQEEAAEVTAIAQEPV